MVWEGSFAWHDRRPVPGVCIQTPEHDLVDSNYGNEHSQNTNVLLLKALSILLDLLSFATLLV